MSVVSLNNPNSGSHGKVFEPDVELFKKITDPRLGGLIGPLKVAIAKSADFLNEGKEIGAFVSTIRLYSERGLLNTLHRIWQAVLAIFGKSSWQASLKWIASKTPVVESVKGEQGHPLEGPVAAELILKVAILAQQYKLTIDNSNEASSSDEVGSQDPNNKILDGLAGLVKKPIAQWYDFKKEEQQVKNLVSTLSLYSRRGLLNTLHRVWQAVLAIFGKGCWKASLKLIASKVGVLTVIKRLVGQTSLKDLAAAELLLKIAVLAQRYKVGSIDMN